MFGVADSLQMKEVVCWSTLGPLMERPGPGFDNTLWPLHSGVHTCMYTKLPVRATVMECRPIAGMVVNWGPSQLGTRFARGEVRGIL